MDRPLNICAFSRANYWHGIKGGMEIHGKMLSEGFAKLGHRIAMICTRHPEAITYENRNGVEIYYLENSVFSSRRHGWAQKSLSKCLELNRKDPFDVIWSQSYDAFGLVNRGERMLPLPVVLTLHGSIEQELRTFMVNLPQHIQRPVAIVKGLGGLFFSYFISQRPLLRIADRIITVSEKVKKDLGKWYGKKVSAKCMTIPSGLDLETFSPDPEQRGYIRNKYRMNDDETLILSAGRITHEKGHHLGIEAIKRIKQHGRKVKLMIIGEGPNLNGLKLGAEQMGCKEDVIFAGAVENDLIPKYYNGADIFVIPTLTVEGFPYVLMEAMACAKPVIASRIGGIVDGISDRKNGLLFSPGDIDALADKIIELTDNKQFRGALSEAARATAIEKFGMDRMISDTLAVMRSAASEGIHH